MVLVLVGVIQFNGERISFQPGLVGFVAAKANPYPIVFGAVDGNTAGHQAHTINAHGIEGIYPVFGRQGNAYFTNGFFVEKWPVVFSSLGKKQGRCEGNQREQQSFHVVSVHRILKKSY